MQYGARFLCARCYHLQVNGPRPPRVLASTTFLAMAWLCLAALALAGFGLCALYLAGTGDITWFAILGALAVLVAACPLATLTRKRNLALLCASLYLPLGLWAYLWHLAPGVGWEYSGMTSYGGLFFLAVGVTALLVFLRDMRGLPRA